MSDREHPRLFFWMCLSAYLLLILVPAYIFTALVTHDWTMTTWEQPVR
jgi:hypothetical protein